MAKYKAHFVTLLLFPLVTASDTLLYPLYAVGVGLANVNWILHVSK